MHLSPVARILARPKLSLLGEHWGVQLPDGNMIHLTPDGASLVSLEQFLEGKTARVVRVSSATQTRQIVWRAWNALSRPQVYRLLDRNCETFANEILGEEPESSQVQGVVLLGLIALTLKAM